MKTIAAAADGFGETVDCLVVGVDGQGRLGSMAAKVDQSQGGWLSRAVDRGDVSGARFDSVLIPSRDDGSGGPMSFLILGTGDAETIDNGIAYQLGATASRRLSDRKRERIAVAVDDFVAPNQHVDFIAGAVSGTVGQDLYQKKPKTYAPETLLLMGSTEPEVAAGKALGDSINLTRNLVNQPANVIYPESFVQRVQEFASELDIEIEVWDEAKLRTERCEALLAVGRASNHESRLLIMRYNGGGDDAPLALVGKGVTFDSGGLSLKPTPSMVDMKCDMAGAATVVGTMMAIAKLKLKRNVIGYCGLVENMISGDAFRLGDVIQTRSGKTIEILNTDAEGRVVLADVLDVAREASPAAMIDLATLTGACLIALGNDVCGLFSNDSEWVEKVRVAAEVAGEPVWELPMFDFFAEQIRSKIADIKNTGEGRSGGAITAAKFLEEFVGSTPWVHIDIAGPAFAESARPFRDAGATGAMLRTLIRVVEGLE